MYSVKKNGAIKLPRGDTLQLKVTFTGTDYPDGTVAVFGLSTRRDGRKVFNKVFPVEGNGIILYLSNPETRKIPVGEYYWDLRVVTDPEYEEDGSVHCDDMGDNVTSVFSGSGMPSFEVTEVAVNV